MWVKLPVELAWAGDGPRRRVRAGHRGADGQAGAHDGGGGDGRVTPGFPTSGTDRGWAFAHLALLSLLAECPGGPPQGSGVAAPVRAGAPRSKSWHNGMTQMRTQSDQKANARSRIRHAGAVMPSGGGGRMFHRAGRPSGAVAGGGTSGWLVPYRLRTRTDTAIHATYRLPGPHYQSIKCRGKCDREQIVVPGSKTEKPDVGCRYCPRTPQMVRASIRPSVISRESRSAASTQRASAASSPGRSVPPTTVAA